MIVNINSIVPSSIFKIALTASFFMFAFACKKDKHEPDHSCGHWAYEGEFGPDHWDDLAPVCEEYAHCGGTAQSPIDIAGAMPDTSLGGLAFHYEHSTTHIIHNGHTIEFEMEEGSVLNLNGESYKLIQFHFHGQSEHTIGGAPHHLEAHFVHANANGDRAVVGVMIKDGAENPFLSPFMSHLPNYHAIKEYKSNQTFHPEDFLPADRSYFTYPGSLTTPPCDENVTWFVLEHPVEASSVQILRFRDLMPKNYRPQALLGSRQIRHFRE